MISRGEHFLADTSQEGERREPFYYKNVALPRLQFEYPLDGKDTLSLLITCSERDQTEKKISTFRILSPSEEMLRTLTAAQRFGGSLTLIPSKDGNDIAQVKSGLSPLKKVRSRYLKESPKRSDSENTHLFYPWGNALRTPHEFARTFQQLQNEYRQPFQGEPWEKIQQSISLREESSPEAKELIRCLRKAQDPSLSSFRITRQNANAYLLAPGDITVSADGRRFAMSLHSDTPLETYVTPIKSRRLKERLESALSSVNPITVAFQSSDAPTASYTITANDIPIRPIPPTDSLHKALLNHLPFNALQFAPDIRQMFEQGRQSQVLISKDGNKWRELAPGEAATKEPLPVLKVTDTNAYREIQQGSPEGSTCFIRSFAKVAQEITPGQSYQLRRSLAEPSQLQPDPLSYLKNQSSPYTVTIGMIKNDPGNQNIPSHISMREKEIRICLAPQQNLGGITGDLRRLTEEVANYLGPICQYQSSLPKSLSAYFSRFPPQNALWKSNRYKYGWKELGGNVLPAPPKERSSDISETSETPQKTSDEKTASLSRRGSEKNIERWLQELSAEQSHAMSPQGRTAPRSPRAPSFKGNGVFLQVDEKGELFLENYYEEPFDFGKITYDRESHIVQREGENFAYLHSEPECRDQLYTEHGWTEPEHLVPQRHKQPQTRLQNDTILVQQRDADGTYEMQCYDGHTPSRNLRLARNPQNDLFSIDGVPLGFAGSAHRMMKNARLEHIRPLYGETDYISMNHPAIQAALSKQATQDPPTPPQRNQDRLKNPRRLENTFQR